jgi:hypothetical protein
MADQLVLPIGGLPWDPGAGAILVEELLRYDAPLIGVLEQAGNKYLFWCILGQADPSSLWAYVLLEESDIVLLQEADYRTLNAVVASIAEGRTVQFAMVLKDQIQWTQTFRSLATPPVLGVSEFPGAITVIEEVVGAMAAELRSTAGRMDDLGEGAHELAPAPD